MCNGIKHKFIYFIYAFGLFNKLHNSNSFICLFTDKSDIYISVLSCADYEFFIVLNQIFIVSVVVIVSVKCSDIVFSKNVRSKI